MYSVLPYYLATFVCTLPLEIPAGVLNSSVMYWMTNLRPGGYLVYVGITLLSVDPMSAEWHRLTSRTQRRQSCCSHMRPARRTSHSQKQPEVSSVSSPPAARYPLTMPWPLQ